MKLFLLVLPIATIYGQECSSKLTLKPNEKQISVHIGDSVAVTCIGPGLPGRRNTLLNWEFVNKSKIPTNMKTSSRDDIHTNKVICDVEKLDILGFKKENEGDYRCIQKENHSPHAIRSHADVRIVMKDPELPAIQINVSQSLKIIKGTTITLPCFATGSPVPQIKWRSNDKQQSPSCTGHPCNWNVTASKNMTYWCEAHNNIGNDTKNVTIEVLERPLVKDMIYIEQNKVYCTSELVHPQPTFYWRYHEFYNCTTEEKCTYQKKWRNSSAPDFEISEVITKTLIKSSLVIHKRPIKAVLQCIATNKAGSANRTIKISLEDNEKMKNGLSDAIVVSIIAGIVLLLMISLMLVIQVRKRCFHRCAKFMSPYSDYKLRSDVNIMNQGLHLPYDTSLEYPRDRLEFIRILGSGAFGQVWLAYAMDLSQNVNIGNGNTICLKKTSKKSDKDFTTAYVAVKALKEDASESEYKDLASEIKVLIYIGKHCNIVNLLGACTKKGSLFAIMEYCPYGNLKSFLRSKRECYSSQWPTTLHEMGDSLTLGDLASIIYQIAAGMEFLHSMELIHRDLATRNILLGEHYCVKISDFGLARDINVDSNYVKTTAGRLPIKWMSPESINERIFNKKTDVWSFGVVLWEIFTLGGTPYPGISVEHLYKYLTSGCRMEQPDICPDLFFHIMLNCWESDPSEREGCQALVRDIDEILKTNLKDNPYLRNANEDWDSETVFESNEKTTPVCPMTLGKRFRLRVSKLFSSRRSKPGSQSDDHLLNSRLASTSSDGDV